MLEKTLETLEFHKICTILETFATTHIGKKLAIDLRPFFKKEDIEKAQKQTTEATILLLRKGNIPINVFEDITVHIQKLNSSLFLSTKQLLDLAHILQIANQLKDYFQSNEIDMTAFPLLEPLFKNLYTNSSIAKAISVAILDENTIADEASKELSHIRRNLRNKEQDIRTKLNTYLHAKYIQEPIVTMRAGRFVIPVKNEYRSEIKGFIHDISASGSTVFIEPLSIFDLNNELNTLKHDETIEIEKILQKLSSLFLNIIPQIENNINLLGLIDFIFAKAKYSNYLQAVEPKINSEKYLHLIDAWHPLLNVATAVRNTISIGNSYTSLIITGPNTGGKTVTLKTAGLLMLMAMSGLHITAKEGSSIYLFDFVFTDIGDEQSIATSLSTFSSHMTNIANILNQATANSFVLLDELGSGTDPVEGSSLAISILETLHHLGALTLATTHFPEIKQFALLTDGFENASVEFNLDTLSPTYRLLLGVPGTSNAFAISSKLGISDTIIERAKSMISHSNLQMEELLNTIYQDKQKIEEEKLAITKNAETIETLKKSLEKDYTSLKEKEKTYIDKAKEEAQNILLEAKEEANQMIKALEKTTNLKTANQIRSKFHKKLDVLKDDTSVQIDEKKSLSKEDLLPHTEVFIPRIHQTGTILSVSKDEKVQVQLPFGKMLFSISDLEKTTSPKSKEKNIPHSKKEFQVKSISSEIHVLGKTVDEACFMIDKYLDDCYLNGLLTIRIIHGKGTGALRTGIHQFLKTHPHVQDYRLGTFGEGEMGVTIVHLK